MSILATWSLDLENDASSVVFMVDGVELTRIDYSLHRVTIPAKTRARKNYPLYWELSLLVTLVLDYQDAVRSMMADGVEKTLSHQGDAPAPPGL